VRWLLPIFDGPGDGWRKDLHPGYKSARPVQDEDLRSQWPLVARLTVALRLPPLAVPSVEADDLIAAYTEALVERGCEVVIVSNDKDLLQLVRGEDGPGAVQQLARVRQGFELRGPAEVFAKWGVYPEQLGDLLALAGDTTDSIPGVPGIGPKTAAKILTSRGGLEKALDEWSLIQGKASELVRDHADQARLSRKLVALRADTPLPLGLDELRPWVPSRIALDDFFRELGYPRFESAVDAYKGPT
jgi:DNA polymerase-1